jgi:hypothetical protein
MTTAQIIVALLVILVIAVIAYFVWKRSRTLNCGSLVIFASAADPTKFLAINAGGAVSGASSVPTKFKMVAAFGKVARLTTQTHLRFYDSVSKKYLGALKNSSSQCMGVANADPSDWVLSTHPAPDETLTSGHEYDLSPIDSINNTCGRGSNLQPSMQIVAARSPWIVTKAQ